jgi:hypothetical protein
MGTGPSPSGSSAWPGVAYGVIVRVDDGILLSVSESSTLGVRAGVRLGIDDGVPVGTRDDVGRGVKEGTTLEVGDGMRLGVEGWRTSGPGDGTGLSFGAGEGTESLPMSSPGIEAHAQKKPCITNTKRAFTKNWRQDFIKSPWG